jgi:hypothetical protein
MLYKEVKSLWAEFFALRLWTCSGHPLATTSRAMGKWMSRLDSAGQKGPEITLEGILIVVEGWFTADISDRARELLCNPLTRNFAYLVNVVMGQEGKCQPA